MSLRPDCNDNGVHPAGSLLHTDMVDYLRSSIDLHPDKASLMISCFLYDRLEITSDFMNFSASRRFNIWTDIPSAGELSHNPASPRNSLNGSFMPNMRDSACDVLSRLKSGASSFSFTLGFIRRRPSRFAGSTPFRREVPAFT